MDKRIIAVALTFFFASITNASIVNYQFEGVVDSYAESTVFTDGFQPVGDLSGEAFVISVNFDTDDVSDGYDASTPFRPYAWPYLKSFTISFESGLFSVVERGSRGATFDSGSSIWTIRSSVSGTPEATNIPQANTPVANMNITLGFQIDPLVFSTHPDDLTYQARESALRSIDQTAITNISLWMSVSNEGESTYPCGSLEGFCYNYHQGWYNIGSSNVSFVPIPAGYILFLSSLISVLSARSFNKARQNRPSGWTR